MRDARDNNNTCGDNAFNHNQWSIITGVYQIVISKNFMAAKKKAAKKKVAKKAVKKTVKKAAKKKVAKKKKK